MNGVRPASQIALHAGAADASIPPLDTTRPPAQRAVELARA
jgi:hypothetical protein